MIDSLRVFIAGISGSGKTWTANDLYISRLPRSIVIDQTGEWSHDVTHAVHDLASLTRAVQHYAPSGEWTISYSNADGRFPDLVRWLVPTPRIDLSPVLALGGVALQISEVDLLAPFGGPPEHIRTLYRRSRHAGLTVISDTQRPGNVSREVTAQCTHIVAHTLSEPRDRDYIASLMRWGPEQVARWIDWTRQHPHGCVWKNLANADCRWLTRNR